MYQIWVMPVAGSGFGLSKAGSRLRTKVEINLAPHRSAPVLQPQRLAPPPQHLALLRQLWILCPALASARSTASAARSSARRRPRSTRCGLLSAGSQLSTRLPCELSTRMGALRHTQNSRTFSAEMPRRLQSWRSVASKSAHLLHAGCSSSASSGARRAACP